MSNPLYEPGTLFDVALMNPNPTARSTKDGPVYRVSFEVDRDLWDLFMGAPVKGMILAGKLFRSEDGEVEVPEHDGRQTEIKGAHGAYWRKVIGSGFFHAPPVLAALGTDADYQEWVRKQHSPLSGQSDWDETFGENRNEYAHVRRVSEGSGTGTKPDYCGVPLRHREHLQQHQIGEAGVLKLYGRAVPEFEDAEQAKEWFWNKAMQFRIRWATNRMRELFEVESLSEVAPERFLEWCAAEDLGLYLKGELR